MPKIMSTEYKPGRRVAERALAHKPGTPGAAGYCTWRRKLPGYVVTLHLPSCDESDDSGRIGAAKATAWALDPSRRYLPEVVVGLATHWCPTCLLGERDEDAQ